MMNTKTLLGIVTVGAILVTAFALQNENAPKEKAEPIATISVQASETRRIPLNAGRPMRLTISLSGKSQEELYRRMEELRSAVLARVDSLNSGKSNPVHVSRESLQLTRTAEDDSSFRARQSFTVSANPQMAEALSGAVSEIPDVEIVPASGKSAKIPDLTLKGFVETVCKEALSKAAKQASSASSNLDTGRVLYAKAMLETFPSGMGEATVEASLFLQKELLANKAERATANPPAKLEVQADKSKNFAADEFLTFLQLEVHGPDKKALYRQTTERNAEILRQLRDLGVLERDISSGPISLTKDFRYNHQTGKRELLGYKACKFFEVTTRSKDSAGAVVKAFARTNDLQNNGTEPRLSASKRQEAWASLSKTAVGSAEEKAKLFAEGLGMHLGRILSMDESAESDARQYSRALKASGAVELSDGIGNAAEAIADSVEVSSAARLVFELQ